MSTSILKSNHELRQVLLAGSGIALIVLLAIAAPLITPADPTVMNITDRFADSSWAHPLGTDVLGHDVLAQLLYGARVSLAVAFSSAILAALIGVSLGLLGGYFKGIAEFIALRLTDVILSFPPILLALLVVTFVGPGAVTLSIVLAILNTPNFLRITYSAVLSVRKLEYVEAATALGASNARIILRTILPNILPPLLVQLSLTVSSVILLESGLSFLGLGVTPPTPSWGLMVQSARGAMIAHPIGLLWPCLALALTIFSVNRFCDVLQSVLDPREARAGKAARWRKSTVDSEAFKSASLQSAEASPKALQVNGLNVVVQTADGERTAVSDVSFSIGRGETVALVGESGSGKSLTSLSIMRLLKSGVRVSSGEILFATQSIHGKSSNLDLVKASDARVRKMRGSDMAMVFQEPMTSLNPVYKIGYQIVESILNHRSVTRSEARGAALQMLTKVGITDPKRRLNQYPHELSGGMRQRVMIALALCCDPALLIADEPTTALDVTLQAEILSLLKKQQNERHGAMSTLFITHNLGVVAQIADRVVVLYAGRVVEDGPTSEVFRAPKHPYTRGLLACIPDATNGMQQRASQRRLYAIPGAVPTVMPKGCTFSPRCDMAVDACRVSEPALESVGLQGHLSRCVRWREC
jgi:peptide/nickel transport system permease protein